MLLPLSGVPFLPYLIYVISSFVGKGLDCAKSGPLDSHVGLTKSASDVVTAPSFLLEVKCTDMSSRSTPENFRPLDPSVELERLWLPAAWFCLRPCSSWFRRASLLSLWSGGNKQLFAHSLANSLAGLEVLRIHVCISVLSSTRLWVPWRQECCLPYLMLYPLCLEQYLEHSWCLINTCLRKNEEEGKDHEAFGQPWVKWEMCTGEVDRWLGDYLCIFKLVKSVVSAKKWRSGPQKRLRTTGWKPQESCGFKDTKNIFSLGVQ